MTWPTTCGSKRCGSHPVAATPTGRARSGSWCAQPGCRRPRRRGAGAAHRAPAGLIDGSDAWPKTKRDELVGSLKNKPGLRRLLRRTGPGCCDRPRRRRTGSPLRRQVAAAHLRPDADRRGPGRRLQAAHRRGTRLARLQNQSRAAPGLPPPRGPHPRPCPIMLAGTASHPCRRNPRRRHLAQPASRTRPHAPGHPRHRPTAASPSARPPPATRRPFWPRSTCPNRPATSTSHPSTAHPPTKPHVRAPGRVVTRPKPSHPTFTQVMPRFPDSCAH